ncbi:right-handed parallel beta-helix repeat-containing protein [Sphingomonas lenta]|uniref:right-handed parallel beta-helix repeat-containing protein n=1 Tax=Sphingomonas lenta TaxID=1141887 RepID=UPI001140BBB3|nr:right-handed parallel beta-helix repeat-containing protein [Sphingomonas lenta]
MRRLALLAVLFAGPAPTQAPGAPFTVAETGRSYRQLQEAVDAIGDGAGTIRIAPGVHRDCAVQERGTVSFVAAQPGAVVFDRMVCESKAALVLRGRGARVDGIVFRNLEVADGNGAGIRIEKGNLDVANSMFLDSQSGILSANDPAGRISIDHSTFAGLGKDPTGNGAHGMYIGDYGSLRVTNSRFERGTGGHYLKNRAARVEILNNSFDDTRGRTTNYMIDLSNGATGRIAGNEFVQGREKDNYSTMIAVSPEGVQNSSEGLVVENNGARLAPGAERTTFLGAWSNEPMVIRGNRLGVGIAERGRRYL